MNTSRAALTLIAAIVVPVAAPAAGGDPVFAGVWSQKEPGVGGLFVGQSWDGLVSHWKDMGANQYLADVEVYVENGRRRYAGLWRVGPGNGALYLLPSVHGLGLLLTGGLMLYEAAFAARTPSNEPIPSISGRCRCPSAEAASATSLDDLQGLKLGAQLGTTSLDFINEVIQPEQEAFVYNDNNAAKAALDAQQVDGIVLDLPTAFYVSAVEIEGTAVIGQFPASGDEPEQFGLVFEEGNPLRDCVNEALASLRDSGELAEIEQRWLSEVVDAPVIPLD